MKQADYVGNNTGRCWISSESGLIWSFLGPVYLILFINAIILISSAIRIGTARKQLSALRKFRGFLISAIILTPVLGLPWIVSLAKFATLSIENITAYQILDTFADWVFICLNSPAGVIFFFIILNRFKEFRKSSKKGNATHSQHISSITGARSRDYALATQRYKKPRAQRANSGSKGAIPIHSEKPNPKEFASNIMTKSEHIDHDTNVIPDGKPLRPRLPKPQKPQPPLHPQEDDIFVYENNMTENPLYVPIDDISKSTAATGEVNTAANVEEPIYQNAANIEQGPILTKNNLIEEDLAIPNPLYDPIEPIDIDIPLTSHLSSSMTSFHASTVSLHKVSGNKLQTATTFMNLNAELELGEIDGKISPLIQDDLTRISPSFEREPENFIRQSLNKLRSSLKLKLSLSNEPVTSIPPPRPPRPSPEVLSKPKPKENLYQNKYLEHLHKIYSSKSQLHVQKISESRINLFPDIQGPKPSPQPQQPEIPTPYRGRVSTLKDKFDKPHTTSDIPPKRSISQQKEIEMSTIDYKSENSSKRDSLLSSTSECEIPVSQSPSAKFPPENHNMSTSFIQATTTPEKSISPSNTSEEHPHDSNEKVPETHYEFEDNFTTSPTPSDALESPVKTKSFVSSIVTSFNEDTASNSSATSSPIKPDTYPPQKEENFNPFIETEILPDASTETQSVESKSSTPTKASLTREASESSDTSSAIYSPVERKPSIIHSATSVEILASPTTILKQDLGSEVSETKMRIRSSISSQESDNSAVSSGPNSPIKSIESNFPDSREVSSTTTRKIILISPTKEFPTTKSGKSSSTKFMIKPLARSKQSDSAEAEMSSKSPPPPKSMITSFRSISSTSSNGKDTNSLSSVTSSPIKPISFTYQPPTDVTKVVTSKKTTFSTSHSVDQSLPEDVPKLKESECVSPPPIKPKLTTLKTTDTPGAFSLHLRSLDSDKDGAESKSILRPRRSSESFPHSKRSTGRISGRISFFEGEDAKTLPRSAKTSSSYTRSIPDSQESISPLKSLDISSPSPTKMKKSQSLNSFSLPTKTEPMSPSNLTSSQEIENTKKGKSKRNSEVFQTEL